MRHQVAHRKLGVKSAHRKAMLANLASSLLLKGRIFTTMARAKELRPIADRMVTLGKAGTLHARRRAVSILRNKDAVKVAFDDLAKRFASRNGGYTRIMKLGWRHGDAAPMAAIEYLESERATTGEHKKEHKEKEHKKEHHKGAHKDLADKAAKEVHAKSAAKGGKKPAAAKHKSVHRKVLQSD